MQQLYDAKLLFLYYIAYDNNGRVDERKLPPSDFYMADAALKCKISTPKIAGNYYYRFGIGYKDIRPSINSKRVLVFSK